MPFIVPTHTETHTDTPGSQATRILNALNLWHILNSIEFARCFVVEHTAHTLVHTYFFDLFFKPESNSKYCY